MMLRVHAFQPPAGPTLRRSSARTGIALRSRVHLVPARPGRAAAWANPWRPAHLEPTRSAAGLESLSLVVTEIGSKHSLLLSVRLSWNVATQGAFRAAFLPKIAQSSLGLVAGD